MGVERHVGLSIWWAYPPHDWVGIGGTRTVGCLPTQAPAIKAFVGTAWQVTRLGDKAAVYAVWLPGFVVFAQLPGCGETE